MDLKNGCLICESKESKEMMNMCSTLEDMLKSDSEFVKLACETVRTLRQEIDELEKENEELKNELKYLKEKPHKHCDGLNYC